MRSLRLFALLAAALPLRAGALDVAAQGPASLDSSGLGAFFDNAHSIGAPVVAAAPHGEVSASAVGVPFNGIQLPSVMFPERQSVVQQLVAAIDAAQTNIRLLLYDLTLPEVVDALKRAHDRNPPVRVQVVVDEGHIFPQRGAQGPEVAALLADPKIEVRSMRGTGPYGIMHNKVGIFDDKLVEYGSFNWTTAAERNNHENALFTSEPGRVGNYLQYWNYVWGNSSPPDSPHGAPNLPGPPPGDASLSVRFNGQPFPAVIFSPNGGTAQWVQHAVKVSQRSIDVAMYSLFDQGDADALVARWKAGLPVRLVTDRLQSNGSPVVKDLVKMGFPLRITSGRGGGKGVMHDKFAVFDGLMVETGSYNWTNNAENNNFENGNFLTDPDTVRAFQADFEALWAEAKPPAPAAETASLAAPAP